MRRIISSTHPFCPVFTTYANSLHQKKDLRIIDFSDSPLGSGAGRDDNCASAVAEGHFSNFGDAILTSVDGFANQSFRTSVRGNFLSHTPSLCFLHTISRNLGTLSFLGTLFWASQRLNLGVSTGSGHDA